MLCNCHGLVTRSTWKHKNGYGIKFFRRYGSVLMLSGSVIVLKGRWEERKEGSERLGWPKSRLPKCSYRSSLDGRGKPRESKCTEGKLKESTKQTHTSYERLSSPLFSPDLTFPEVCLLSARYNLPHMGLNFCPDRIWKYPEPCFWTLTKYKPRMGKKKPRAYGVLTWRGKQIRGDRQRY